MTPGSSHGRRIEYYDILAILASIAVVSMHSNAFWHYRDSPSWILNTGIEVTMRWAVPVFFMLTGAKLFNYRTHYTTRVYFVKRIRQVVIPFVVWSILGLLFAIHVSNSISRYESPIYYFDILINAKIPDVNVYWFFIPLFTIYICIPVLSLIPQERRNRVYIFLVGWTLIVNLLAKTLPFVGIEFNTYWYNPLCSGWLIYPLIGYLLSGNEVSTIFRYLSYVLALMSCVLSFYITLQKGFSTGRAINLFPTGQELPYVFTSVAVFLFVKTFVCKHQFFFTKHSNAIKKLATASFGVYLIHMFLINLFVKYQLIDTLRWWSPFLIIPLIWLLSMSISVVLGKIPFVQEIV